MQRTGDFMGTGWARSIVSMVVIALAATALPVAALAAQAAAPTLSLSASPVVSHGRGGRDPQRPPSTCRAPR